MFPEAFHQAQEDIWFGRVEEFLDGDFKCIAIYYEQMG